MEAKPKKPSRPLRSDALTQVLRDVEITLDNGDTVSLDPWAEVRIPDNLNLIPSELAKAPARYAFWSYQADRALRAVREQENEVKRIVAECGLTAREVIRQGQNDVTEAKVREHVDVNKRVREAREKLIEFQAAYDMLKTVANAHNHRCFILQRIGSTLQA